jgi:predicted aspartyl protease
MKLALTSVLLVAIGSAQGADSQPCHYEGGAALPLAITGSALRPTLYGKLNGTSVPMLVDTGAYRTFLTARYVERLGIPAKPIQKYRGGIGGEQFILAAHVQEWSIGPANPTKGEFPVMGDFADNFPYATIIGADILTHRDLEIDMSERSLQFFHPHNCSKDAVLFPEASVVPSEALSYDKRRYFTVSVNGVPMRTLIDTGAPTSIIDTVAAERAGISAAMPGARSKGVTSGIGGRPVKSWYVPVDKLDIGKEAYAGIRLAMGAIENNSGEKNHTDLILGTDFLRSYRVLFANSQDKIYLTRTAPLKLVGSDEDWAAMVEAEAAKGNPGALGGLALLLAHGKGIAKDVPRAFRLDAEASAQGDFLASSRLALRDFVAGEFSKAAPALRKLSADPGATRYTDLLAFVASIRNGERETALADLKNVRKRANDSRWPLAVVDFMLGDKDAEYVLRAVSKDEIDPKGRECEAHFYIGHGNWQRGDAAGARREFETALTKCESKGFERGASAAALNEINRQ